MFKFTAYIERDPETGYYVGIVPDIPGAHTQGETMDELLENITEVVSLCLEELNPEELSDFPEFCNLKKGS